MKIIGDSMANYFNYSQSHLNNDLDTNLWSRDDTRARISDVEYKLATIDVEQYGLILQAEMKDML